MEYINGFVKNIVIFVMFINIGSILISDSDNKKIYKLVSGLVMIVIVLHSIFSLAGINVDEIFKNELSASIINELQLQIDSNNEYLKDNALSTYEKIIKENMKRCVEAENYRLVKLVSSIDSDSGYVSHIDMWIIPNRIVSNNSWKYDNNEIYGIDNIDEVRIDNIDMNENNITNDKIDNNMHSNQNEINDISIHNEHSIVIGNIKKNAFILYGISYENINIYINEVEDEGL